MNDVPMKDQGEKIQKVLAQAGWGSRRMMEQWIIDGRVSVNGEQATLGMRVVQGDVLKAERHTMHVGAKVQAVRVLLYHKPEGEIVSRDDPDETIENHNRSRSRKELLYVGGA